MFCAFLHFCEVNCQLSLRAFTIRATIHSRTKALDRLDGLG